MRRALVCLVGVSALAVAAVASAKTTVVRTSFAFDYDDAVSGLCAFEIRVAGRQEHDQAFHFSNLPADMTPDSPGALVYQVYGTHWTDTRETYSNPANGRSVDLHSVDRLLRRDFSFDGTVDPVTGFTGSLFATDENSYSYIATAPGERRPVVQITGHERRHHTGIFVNDVRVDREDTPFFTKGMFRERICEYLAG